MRTGAVGYFFLSALILLVGSTAGSAMAQTFGDSKSSSENVEDYSNEFILDVTPIPTLTERSAVVPRWTAVPSYPTPLPTMRPMTNQYEMPTRAVVNEASEYERGRILANKGMHKDAMQVWLPLARGGMAMAQVSVGRLIANGDGVQKSFEVAALWFQKAAAQGNPEAEFFLGQMYQYGHGVTKDLEKSKQWYEKAAAHGHPDAGRRLRRLPR